jgi:hypothetical protein
MSTGIYDYTVIGLGISGSITLLKILEKSPEANVLIIEKDLATPKGICCFWSRENTVLDPL